jgi:TetR/AcrR family transcriptional regulator, transcriptional repressor for nem operon
MNTKELIIATANKLLIERGYNAFSYKNISEQIGIKTSSIHYHFPAKTDLGVAIIKSHSKALRDTIERTRDKNALEKLHKLFLYYKRLAHDNKVCIVSALTSDVNTLDEPVRLELVQFSNEVVDWTAFILEEGQLQNTFKPMADIRLKAKMIIANLMALIQIIRIEKSEKLFDQMTDLILAELAVN